MFHFSLVTPEKKLITDLEVEEVIVPGHRGELDILTGHAPMVTTLGVGVLRYRRKGSQTFEAAAIGWGYAEVGSQGLNVLAEMAETKEEIDKERAKIALEEAKKRLTDPDLEANQMKKFRRQIEKAQVRLDLLEKH